MSEHRTPRATWSSSCCASAAGGRGPRTASPPEGELDLSSSLALARELDAARDSDAERIVLDLSGLTFVDCAGLRVILCMDAHSSDRPGRFLVRRAPARVHRIFSLTSAARQLSFI